MKFTIYQIDMGRDKLGMSFESLKSLKDRGMITSIEEPEIEAEIYNKVYSCDDKTVHDLEEIYRKFNINKPANYMGRSFSVSDIVEIHEGNTQVNAGTYYCDAIGFKEIDFNVNMVGGCI